MSQIQDQKDLNTKQFPTWCGGCGDLGIWAALKQAIVAQKLRWEQVVIVYGIGCSGNMASFLKVYGFHGLHGRALPAAEGIKTANHKLKVIVVAGDGDLLGEGMGHFVASCRANHDLTVILHNNQVYGLTTGQNAPTTLKGVKSKSTPLGVIDEPINPIQLALVSGAKHVARGFAGDINHLTGLIGQALSYNGFSLVDVLQPCVTFNKLNTYQWFRDRLQYLEKPATSAIEALRLGVWTDKQIRIGTFYQATAKSFTDQIDLLKEKTLIQYQPIKQDLTPILSDLK